MNEKYSDFIYEFCNSFDKYSSLPPVKIEYKDAEDLKDCNTDQLILQFPEFESPGITLGISARQIYNLYSSGLPLKKLIEGISYQLQNLACDDILSFHKLLHHYDELKKKLYISPRSLVKDCDRLSCSVYKAEGDIALAVYLRAGFQNGCLTCMRISPEHVRKLRINEADLIRDALQNTALLAPPRLFSLEEAILDAQYAGEDFMAGDYVLPEKEDIPGGICLSTTEKQNGAAAIFYPGVAERISELLGGDLYLAFTSRHEVMVHRTDAIDLSVIREVLTDTIKTAATESDFLTDHVYMYHKEAHTFEML